MTIIDAITSSPLNVFFTIVIGLGLAYLYYRKPPSSSSSSSTTTSTSAAAHHHLARAFATAHRSSLGLDAGVIDEELQRTIARIERQERDMIRQEQDEAYQQSLKADREKKLKKEQELKAKEEKEKQEREKAEQTERLHQSLTELRSQITSRIPPNRSDTNGSKDLVKLVFKLPDGTRVKRNFCKTDKVKLLYWFVFSLKNAPLQFKMTTNFPKRDLPGRPPIPEDFYHGEDDDTPSPVRRDSASSTKSGININSSSAKTTSSIEPNCERTLEEIELTETQIIFVYDLEA